jgi:N-acetylglucosaminyldiphosphoundecaprenol N-acetyl-beta-D-mannosaminyltransferase
LLIVALGSPKQEYWIRDHLSRLKSVRVAVGEGGSLDFIAGEFRRAPRWMRESGLEWSWRLFMNKSKTKTGSRPRRVWNAVPLFICKVVAWKLTHGATILEL